MRNIDDGAKPNVCIFYHKVNKQRCVTLMVARVLVLWGPPRGKRDRVIGHISKRENGNWIKDCVIAR